MNSTTKDKLPTQLPWQEALIIYGTRLIVLGLLIFLNLVILVILVLVTNIELHDIRTNVISITFLIPRSLIVYPIILIFFLFAAIYVRARNSRRVMYKRNSTEVVFRLEKTKIQVRYSLVVTLAIVLVLVQILLREWIDLSFSLGTAPPDETRSALIVVPPDGSITSESIDAGDLVLPALVVLPTETSVGPIETPPSLTNSISGGTIVTGSVVASQGGILVYPLWSVEFIDKNGDYSFTPLRIRSIEVLFHGSNPVPVIGKTTDGELLLIRTPESRFGWISSRYLSISGGSTKDIPTVDSRKSALELVLSFGGG